METEAFSTQRKFVVYVPESISIREEPPRLFDPTNIEFDGHGIRYWSVIASTDAEKFLDPYDWHPLGQDKCSIRFSAASIAIHFLRRSSNATRRHLRNLEIHENSSSVAFPECHVQGLIDFCRKYRKLRIQRRVNVLSAVLNRPYLGHTNPLRFCKWS